MELPRPTHSSDLIGIGQPKSTTGGNRNARTGPLHKSSQRINPMQHVRRSARRQQPVRSCRNYVLQRLIEIRDLIERTMKRHLHAIRSPNQLSRALTIHAAIGPQHADDNAARTHPPHRFNLITNRVEIGCRIAEAVGMGSHQHMDGQPAQRHRTLHQPWFRCQTTHLQRPAKLNAIGSSRLCSQAGVERFRAKFEYDRRSQGSSPVSSRAAHRKQYRSVRHPISLNRYLQTLTLVV